MADRTLTFTLLGRDLVSARLRSAGRSADDMAARVTAANAATGGSVAQLVRDSDGRLRTLDGRFATAGEIAEAGLGGGTERGTRRARAGLLSLLPSLSGLGSMGGTVMKVVGPVGKLVATLGAAGPVVAALLTTLANLLPAAGLAATGILMAVSAGAALKIGMSGVSAAISAAFDPATKAADLAAALKGLAPNARSFVIALREIKPQFDGLKLSVQNALFKGLGTTARDLGSSVLPLLKAQLTSSASSLNAMAVGVANAAKNLATSGTLGTALAGANAGLRNLSGIPAHIVTALGQVAAAAAPSFARLTGSAGSAVDKVSAKLSAAFASGGMQKAIDGAIALFGSLFHIIGNVGTILSNVLAQAGGGAGAFGFLTTLTDTLAKVSAMPGVQAAFADLFTVMSEIGKVAGPLLGKALMVIAPVLVALAPAALRLVDSLGAGLEPIITALGPVLLAAAGAVASLADAVSPLLPVVGQMIASLGPVLTPILKIVGVLFASLAPVLATLGAQLLPPLATVTKTLGTVFGQLSPVLTTALQQLGTQGLTPILTGLTTIISQLVTQYAAQFLTMFQQLLPVIPVLIPVVLQLAQSIGQILVAVAPLIPQLMLLAVQLITQVLPAILPLIPVIADLTTAFLWLVTGVITKVVIPVFSGLIKFMQGLQRAFRPAIDAVTWLTKGIAGAFRWLYDVLLGHSIIPDIVRGTVAWFAGLPGKAASAIGGLAGALAGKATAAGSSLITAVRRGIDGAVTVVHGLAGKAKSAVGDLSGVLRKSGQALLRGFIDGIKSMGSLVNSAVSNIVSSARDFFPFSPAKRGAFSGTGYPLYSGRAISASLAAGITSRAGLVSDAARQLAASASGELALPSTTAGQIPVLTQALARAADTAAGTPMGSGTQAPGLGVARSAQPAQVNITVNGAIDPVSTAKQLQKMLLTLKRTSGLNVSLEIG